MKACEFFKAFWNLQSLHKLNSPNVEKGGDISVREILPTGAEKIFVHVRLKLDSN